MRKLFFLPLLLSLLFILSPSKDFLSAQSSPTVAELQAQIKALTAQIQAIIAQRAGMVVQTSSVVSFVSDMGVGSSGSQVANLQNYLISKGYLVMPPGVATGYFGPLTAAAVRKFQGAYSISTTGYVGPLTRAKLNSLRITSTGSTTGSGTLVPNVVGGASGGGGGGGRSRSISIPNPANPTYPAPRITFVSSSYNIALGQSATLSWTTGDTTSCGATGSWSGSKNTGGSETVSPTQASSYTLSCTGPGGSAVQTVTIGVTLSGPTDTTPPTMSNGAPSGTLSAGTTQTNITLSTNESATCRISQSDVVYGLMTTQFITTGGTSHSHPITNLVDGQSYSYYVKCQDAASNASASSLNITFGVGTGAVTPPPSGGTGDTTPPPAPGSPSVTSTSTTATDIVFNLSWTASIDQPGGTAVPNYAYSGGYNDGSNGRVGTTTTNSVSITLPLSSPATTGYFCVRAVDASGNRSTNQSCNALTIPAPSGGGAPPDTTAPTVSMTAPSAGSTVSGSTVTVSATASDNVGVVGVQFKLDGVDLGTEDTTSPYSITWDTTTATNASHSLTAWTHDAAGNITLSSGVSVTVSNTVTPPPSDTTAPTISLTAPTAGSTVSGSTVTVSATASDNVGVVGVLFKLDGVDLGAEDTTSPYSITWDTTTATNASHSLTALARDAAGNQTTSGAVSVTVSNVVTPPTDTTPPTVSITAPTAGATVSGATTVVSASASDNVGVSGVQFRLDGVDLGAEDTTSPYSITWDTTTATNASHSLTATARDAAGNQTTSSGVSVTVNNSAGFATPDILNNASFESGWSGFTDGTLVNPPSGNVTRSQDQAHSGLTSLKFVWNNNTSDTNSQTFYGFSAQSHIWVRAWFYQTAWPNGAGYKFGPRFKDLAANTDAAIQVVNGRLTFMVANPSWISMAYLTTGLPSVNAWHCLEYEVDQPNQEVRFWLDDVQLGNQGIYYDPDRVFSWTGQTLNVGLGRLISPDAIDIVRVINPATNSGAAYFDDVSLSTQGRIGCN